MEPHWVMQSALTNAATVVPLAAVVLIVGRSLRRPALVHVLWVLILVKFITPPLVGVPVPAEWVPKRLTGFAQTYLVAGESQSTQPRIRTPLPTDGSQFKSSHPTGQHPGMHGRLWSRSLPSRTSLAVRLTSRVR